MLGSIDLSYVYQILEAIAGGEPGEVLAIVQAMAEHAPDFEGSLVELISMIHRIAVAQVVPDAIDNSWGDAKRIGKIAGAISAEDAQLYYQVAINGKRDMAFAADPRGGFEMILLRMIAFRPVAVLDESLTAADVKAARTTQSANVAVEVDPGVKKPLEAPLARQPAPALPVSQPQPSEKQDLVESAIAEPVAVRTKSEEKTLKEGQGGTFRLESLSPQSWPSLLEQLGLHGIVYNIASHCELRSCVGSALEFILDENNASLFNDKHRSRISLVLENYFDTKLSVTVECGEPLTETPALQKIRLTTERQGEAVNAIENDPQLQHLIERFDGELLRSSITPIDSGNL
jgi:DNA polymerase-3 subunit gamma/tau